MTNVCFSCGEYSPDKRIDPSGPYAICPQCGHRQPFRRLPLLIVSGASGAGKSSVLRHLTGRLDPVVVMEADILWRPEFNTPEDNYRAFCETWLRVCKNISQSGRPVVLFGAGMGVPENIEPCVERRYFAGVHYLALVCEDEVLAERLRSRPQWRKCDDPAYIEADVQFNRWFKERGSQQEPEIELLDTTGISVEETAQQVAEWIRGKIDADQPYPLGCSI